MAIVGREGVARGTDEAELAVASAVVPAVPAALAADETLEPGAGTPWPTWAAVVFSTASRSVRRFSLVSSEYIDRTR